MTVAAVPALPGHAARTRAEADTGLTVLAMWRVQPGALMLLGRAPGNRPDV